MSGTRSPSCPSCGPPGSAAARLDLLFDLVERLDGLPRHVALHPCGVLLSDATLLDRTPVEASWLGLPDEPVRQGRRRGPSACSSSTCSGIRMQSAMAYALQEVDRVDGQDAVAAGHHPDDGHPTR